MYYFLFNKLYTANAYSILIYNKTRMSKCFLRCYVHGSAVFGACKELPIKFVVCLATIRRYLYAEVRRYQVSTRFHPVLYLALVSVDNTSLQIPLTRPMLALCGEGVSSTRGLREKREHHRCTPTPTSESLFLKLSQKHSSSGSASPLWVYVFFFRTWKETFGFTVTCNFCPFHILRLSHRLNENRPT